MPGKIFIASSNVIFDFANLIPITTPFNHTFLVFDPDGSLDANSSSLSVGDLRYIEGAPGINNVLSLVVDDNIAGTPSKELDKSTPLDGDADDPNDVNPFSAFNYTTLDLGGQDAQTVWNSLVTAANDLGTVNGALIETGLDYDVSGPNSNSVIATLLSTINLDIKTVLPLEGGDAASGSPIPELFTPGLDTLVSHDGDDILQGFTGDDVIYDIAGGTDEFYGGDLINAVRFDTSDGTDQVIYAGSAAGGIVVFDNLRIVQDNNGGTFDDELYSIEKVKFSDYSPLNVLDYSNFTLGPITANGFNVAERTLAGVTTGVRITEASGEEFIAENIGKIIGTAGDDTFSVDGVLSGITAFEGGTGSNTISLSEATQGFGITLDALDGTGVITQTGETDTISLSDISNIVGSLGDDTFVGSDFADTLEGNRGNDLLESNDGADTISGGLGFDGTKTGAGDDTFKFEFNNVFNFGFPTGSVNGFRRPDDWAYIDETVAGGGAGVDQIQITGINKPDLKVSQLGSDLVFYRESSFQGTLVFHEGGFIIKNGALGSPIESIDLAGEVINKQFWDPSDSNYDPLDPDTLTLSTLPSELSTRLNLMITQFETSSQNFDAVGKTISSGGTIIGSASIDDITGDATGQTIFLGDGDDTASGGDGNDLIGGEQGDDIIHGDEGNDAVVGGGGNDTLFGDAGDDDVRGEDGDDTLFGGDGDDDLYGEIGDDIIHAGLGDDLIFGGAGNDTIHGEFGQNTIFGDGGDDIIFMAQDATAASGNAHGGSGNDTIHGGFDNSTGSGPALRGEDGDDTLIATFGNQDYRMFGGAGNDTFIISTPTADPSENVNIRIEDDWAGKQTLEFGQGFSWDDLLETIDVIQWENGALRFDVTDTSVPSNSTRVELRDLNADTPESLDNELRFFDGQTVVMQLGGNSTTLLSGTSDDDLLASGDAASNTINAGAGDDFIGGGNGANTVNAGSGNDIVFGHDGNDILNGDDGADTIFGNLGNDQLYGGIGDDILRGNDGDDEIHGGAGDDRIGGEFSGGQLGDDTIFGGDGNDIIREREGNNFIDGGAGDDDIEVITATGENTIFGGAGDDTINIPVAAMDNFIDGGAGNDFITIASSIGDNQIFGGAGNDIIHGGNGADTLSGGDGDDTITHGNGNGNLIGGSGIDSFNGGAGNDFLDGGTENDILTGGAGDDTYFFDIGYGVDLIQDSSTVGVSDTLLFGNAFNPSNLIFTFDTNNTNLEITFDNSVSDRVALVSQGSDNNRIEHAEFSDGSILNLQAFANWITGTDNAETLNGTTGSDIIWAGADNDTILAGDGNDDIYGGAGDDILNAGLGDDLIFGGTGSDTIAIEQDASATDTVGDFALGSDLIDLSAFDSVFSSFADLQPNISQVGDDAHIDLGNSQTLVLQDVDSSSLAAANFIGNVSLDPILGTPGNDVINGTSGNDFIDGLDGDDTINGGDGDDTLVGGNGFDDIFAGNGDDLIIGGLQPDDIHGEAGTDTLKYNFDFATSNMIIYRDSSANYVVRDTSQSILTGFGLDKVFNDVEFVEFNDITFDIVNNPIILNATAIGNSIDWIGDNTSENITTFFASDNIFANGGDDVINALVGEDVIDGGSGNDIFNGGLGTDTATYANDPNAVNINLGASTGTDGFGDTDTYNSIENVTGSAFNDTIIGDGNANVIEGGLGDDTLTGGAGDDIFVIGVDPGATDTITDFVVGTDRIDLNAFNGTITDFMDLVITQVGADTQVDLGGGQSVLLQNVTATTLTANSFLGDISEGLIFGTSGNDVLNGTAGDDVIDALAGDDTVFGNDGNDTIFGGAGNDNLQGGDGNDIIMGSGGSDTLDGGLGNDELHIADDGSTANGGAGNDIIFGGDDFDVIFGGDGDDTIHGSRAPDDIHGGAGIDTVVYDFDFNGSNMIIYRDNPGHFIVRDTSESILTGFGLDKMFNDVEFVQFNDVTFDIGASPIVLNETAIGNSIDWIGDNTSENITTFFASDNIFANGGDDVINALVGDDVIDGGSGNDTFNGGLGTDTATYANDPNGVTVNLNINVGTDGFGDTDTYNSIENVIGSDFDDVFTGSSGDNVFEAGKGNDVLVAEGGSDTYVFNLGDGDDLIVDNGNSPNDAIRFGAGITLSDLVFTDIEVNDLEITIAGSPGDRIEIRDQRDVGNIHFIEKIIFDDGSEYGFVNSAPIAQDDNFALDRDTNFAGNVFLDNGNGIDSDPDGETFTVQASANITAQGGTVSMSANGDFTYTPPTAFVGTDQYAYTIVDARGATDMAIMAFDVNSIAGDVEGTSGDDTLIGTGAADNLFGGDGDDIIEGKGGPDYIGGGVGNDTISGDGSDDLIYGGTGHDILNGNGGNDIIYGQEGNDTISGQGDDDTLYGGNGDDTIDGNGGNDQIFGEGGDDILEGGADNDTIFGGADNDTITGNGGDDLLYGDAGNDILNGSVGNDQLFGGDGADTLNGNGGDDTLDGGAGDDIVNGSADNDLIISGAGNDNYHGNGGIDTITFAAAVSGVTVDLSNDTATDGFGDTDTLNGLENVTGSAFADTITGNGQDNLINGGAGDDVLDGKGGLDIINGDAGDDTITGGGSDDQLFGGEGNDTIEGNGGLDLIEGQGGDDTLNGGGDADTIRGGTGVDLIDGKAGNDILEGGDGDDTINGGADDDQLFGDAGNDILKGNAGNDIIRGGDGDDEVRGNAGDDVLYGDDGFDQLWGADGADTFVFEAASAFNDVDQVRDFSLTDGDVLNLADLLTYDPLTDVITDFVQITDSGAHSDVFVDADGGADNFVQVAELRNITGLTDELALETSGTLIAA